MELLTVPFRMKELSVLLTVLQVSLLNTHTHTHTHTAIVYVLFQNLNEEGNSSFIF